MANRGTLRFLLLLGRVIERITQKNVSIAVKAMVGFHDGIEGFSKSDFLHGKGAAQGEASAMIISNRSREQIM